MNVLIVMKKEFKLRIIEFIILVILGTLLSVGSLYFSSGSFGIAMFKSYFDNMTIVILNTLPIILSLFLVFYMTGRVWSSFAITSVIVVVFTFINYYKVTFRDDTLLFEDLSLFFEMKNMMGQYKIEFSLSMILWILLIIILFIITFCFRSKETRMRGKEKVIGTIVVCIVSIVVTKFVLLNDVFYAKTANEALINRWGATQQYISRGFVYPFIYSSKSAKMQKPDGYNLKEAKGKLDSYDEEDIPENEKVNVVAIMLEAFADFSEYPELSFSEENNPYTEYKEVQNNSYHGELITSIFAGGTVNTERKFITGANALPSLRKPVPSYARYFASQGYRVEGSHPCYQWFYNRINVNENIGFEKYDFYENRYGELAGGEIANDNILFPELYKDLKQSIDNQIPYFNFSVTYQNHGPYSLERVHDTSYVEWKDTYNDSDYNILNNYFYGIKDTGVQMKRFVEELDNLEAPTVVIFFGDHKPWLGDGNTVYNMIGMEFDLETEEGVKNYYETPYLIHANDKAKEILGNEFIGVGETISPNFLMNEFFDLAGWKGPKFMQFTNELKDKIPMMTNEAFIEDGEFKNILSDQGQELLEEYKKVEYYYLNDLNIDE